MLFLLALFICLIFNVSLTNTLLIFVLLFLFLMVSGE